MRQFEVLSVKIVQLNEQKDNCFRGFFVYLQMVSKLIRAVARTHSAFGYVICFPYLQFTVM